MMLIPVIIQCDSVGNDDYAHSWKHPATLHNNCTRRLKGDNATVNTNAGIIIRLSRGQVQIKALIDT